MRHTKVLEGFNQLVEDFGYALGECQDFLDREELNLCDLLEKVADGSMRVRDAQGVVHLIFTKAGNDLNEWRRLRATTAEQHEHPYLHPELVGFRSGAPLPDVTA